MVLCTAPRALICDFADMPLRQRHNQGSHRRSGRAGRSASQLNVEALGYGYGLKTPVISVIFCSACDV